MEAKAQNPDKRTTITAATFDTRVADVAPVKAKPANKAKERTKSAPCNLSKFVLAPVQALHCATWEWNLRKKK